MHATSIPVYAWYTVCMQQLPTITVVIPTLNEEVNIQSLLADLEAQTCAPVEILVVDGYSPDNTAHIARSKSNAKVISHGPHVARQRNLGGYLARGDVVVFLDADTKLKSNFLEKAISEFQRRKLDIACPWYVPHESTLLIHAVYALFNSTFYLLQKILASGAGSCVIIRKEIFQNSRGFDAKVKFDDIELIRHLSWKYRFGILHTQLGVSDRRFRQYGVLRMTGVYMVLSIFFALGAFRSANIVSYEFGKYDKRRTT